MENPSDGFHQSGRPMPRRVGARDELDVGSPIFRAEFLRAWRLHVHMIHSKSSDGRMTSSVPWCGARSRLWPASKARRRTPAVGPHHLQHLEGTDTSMM